MNGRDGKPDDLPTWRPPPTGTEDQWNGILQDIIGGLNQQEIAYKYKLSESRSGLLILVFAAAEAQRVDTLNGLRQRWVLHED